MNTINRNFEMRTESLLRFKDVITESIAQKSTSIFPDCSSTKIQRFNRRFNTNVN